MVGHNDTTATTLFLDEMAQALAARTMQQLCILNAEEPLLRSIPESNVLAGHHCGIDLTREAVV